MTTLGAIQELRWRQVPAAAIKLAVEVKDTAKRLRKATKDLPTEGFLDLWYRSDDDHATINFGDWAEGDEIDAWRSAVEPLVDSVEIADELGDMSNHGYVKVASRSLAVLRYREKKAADPYLKGLLQHTGYLGGKIPGAPNPIIATLTSGLLGAGLGYGGGYMLEQLMPETEQWNLKPRLAVLGGLAGAAPGAAWMGTNVANDLPFYSGELMKGKGYQPPAVPQRKVNWSDFAHPGVSAPWAKGAAFGEIEDHPDYSFDSQEFNRTIWEDHRVANRLNAPTQAAATGLITGAAHLRGSPRLVSPGDVARLAAGMGAGYTSGAIVGKALGVLMGMPQSTQNKLKQTGMWAGLVSNIVPLAFGGR